MSIYGTECVFCVMDSDDHPVEICVQVVPPWVEFEAAWLPPPRLDTGDAGYLKPRAAFFITLDCGKGGPGYEGQQYHDPLLVMGGEEYERATFRDVMQKLQDAIETKRQPSVGDAGTP